MGYKDHIPTKEEIEKRLRKEERRVSSSAYHGGPAGVSASSFRVGSQQPTQTQTDRTGFPILYNVNDLSGNTAAEVTIDLTTADAHYHIIQISDNAGANAKLDITFEGPVKNRGMQFVLILKKDSNNTNTPTITFTPELNGLPDNFPENEEYVFLVSATRHDSGTRFDILAGGGGSSGGGSPVVLRNLDEKNHGSISAQTLNLDWTVANFHRVTATGDIRFKFQNPPADGKWQEIILEITQDSTGERNLSFVDSFANGTPTIDKTADAVTRLRIYHRADVYVWAPYFASGGGASALSGLSIDVDKDWAEKKISNLGGLALINGSIISGVEAINFGSANDRISERALNNVTTLDFVGDHDHIVSASDTVRYNAATSHDVIFSFGEEANNSRFDVLKITRNYLELGEGIELRFPGLAEITTRKVSNDFDIEFQVGQLRRFLFKFDSADKPIQFTRGTVTVEHSIVDISAVNDHIQLSSISSAAPTTNGAIWLKNKNMRIRTGDKTINMTLLLENPLNGNLSINGNDIIGVNKITMTAESGRDRSITHLKEIDFDDDTPSPTNSDTKIKGISDIEFYHTYSGKHYKIDTRSIGGNTAMRIFGDRVLVGEEGASSTAYSALDGGIIEVGRDIRYRINTGITSSQYSSSKNANAMWFNVPTGKAFDFHFNGGGHSWRMTNTGFAGTVDNCFITADRFNVGKRITLLDVESTPSSAGWLQRSGKKLYYHNGDQAVDLVANAIGVGANNALSNLAAVDINAFLEFHDGANIPGSPGDQGIGYDRNGDMWQRLKSSSDRIVFTFGTNVNNKTEIRKDSIGFFGGRSSDITTNGFIWKSSNTLKARVNGKTVDFANFDTSSLALRALSNLTTTSINEALTFNGAEDTSGARGTNSIGYDTSDNLEIHTESFSKVKFLFGQDTSGVEINRTSIYFPRGQTSDISSNGAIWRSGNTIKARVGGNTVDLSNIGTSSASGANKALSNLENVAINEPLKFDTGTDGGTNGNNSRIIGYGSDNVLRLKVVEGGNPRVEMVFGLRTGVIEFGKGKFKFISGTAATPEVGEMKWDGNDFHFGIRGEDGNGGQLVRKRISAIGSSTIAGLSDVTISNPSDNQFLRHNGSRWVNETVSVSGGLNTAGNYTMTGTWRFNSRVSFPYANNTNSNVAIQAKSINIGSAASTTVFFNCQSNFDFNNKRISKVGTPTSNSDAATKKYVDDNVDAEAASIRLYRNNHWHLVAENAPNLEIGNNFRQGYIMFYPYIPTSTIRIRGFGCYVSRIGTRSSSRVEIGVYSSSGGVPRTRQFWRSISPTTGGFQGRTSSSQSATLTRGELYFFAIYYYRSSSSGSDPQIGFHDLQFMQSIPMTLSNGNSFNTRRAYYTEGRTSDDLPSSIRSSDLRVYTLRYGPAPLFYITEGGHV